MSISNDYSSNIKNNSIKKSWNNINNKVCTTYPI
jgi:hypothetical protein